MEDVPLANRRGRREGDKPVGKVVSIKQVSEIRAGPKVKLLPGFSPDHFFKIGCTLEEQEQCRG